MKGLDLCKHFFFEAAKPVLDLYYPQLKYSAGLIGYGSDVLGYDDAISRDHMWGPRFYLFTEALDIDKKEGIFQTLSEKLPYQYKGYSVNFTEPDLNDGGVQHARFISEGSVNPLIFIQTFESFLEEQLGKSDLESIQPLDWLVFSEHRLLSIKSGTMFIDNLHVMDKVALLEYYPEEVRNYLIASNWDIIASEQAFVKRCGAYGDEIGSAIICARIVERLMRLCFLYNKVYAPYSKWFGTAFEELDICENLKVVLKASLQAGNVDIREQKLVEAQALVADMHNASGITDYIDYHIESYFGRDIKVIYADKFSQAVSETLRGTKLEGIPLIGTLSQIGGLCSMSDEKEYYEQIKLLYETKAGETYL